VNRRRDVGGMDEGPGEGGDVGGEIMEMTSSIDRREASSQYEGTGMV